MNPKNVISKPKCIDYIGKCHKWSFPISNSIIKRLRCIMYTEFSGHKIIGIRYLTSRLSRELVHVNQSLMILCRFVSRLDIRGATTKSH